MDPYELDIQANTKVMTERPSTWIKGPIFSTCRDLLDRSTTMDFMHPLIKMSVKRRAEMYQLQAGWPTIFSFEPTSPPPPSRQDPERPQEGRLQTEVITGRPGYGRPAGPTLQRLELIFAWKLRQPTLLRTPDASAKYRPLASINREPHPHSQHTQRSSLFSHS